METLTYRHELKYEISRLDARLLRAKLSRLLRPDRNMRDGGVYHVRSLYFDTPDDRALREKQAGTDPRRKWRIRLYNRDLGLIRLEKKVKQGTATAKSSLQLTVDQCNRILGLDLAWLPQAEQPLLRELYAEMRCNLLRPRVIVDYTREAYAFPTRDDVRVTLDYDLRTGRNGLDLLNPDLITLPATCVPTTVLEVKYGSFLPEAVIAALQLGNRPRCSVSKYAICRGYN